MLLHLPSPRRWALGTAALIALLAASPAQAEHFRCPTDTLEADRPGVARSLFEQALQLEPGDPDAALLRLRCADKLSERAAVALRMGIISERLERYQQAVAAFESYLARAGDAAPDRPEIEQRIAKLERRLAAQREPNPPAPADDPRPRLAGLITAGLGGAAVLAGSALLIAAKAHADEVHAIEPGTRAWNSDEASGTFAQAKREEGVGIALLILGAAAAGTGLGVAYWPPQAASDTVAVRLTPGGATLRVTF